MNPFLAIFVFASLVLISCSENSKNTLTDTKKEVVKKEIQQVIDQIIDAAAHADTTKLYEAFGFQDSNFLYLETSGAFYNQEKYKQMVRDFYGPLSSEIIGKGDERYTFLDQDNVLWNYSGTLTAKFKTGAMKTYHPFGMTMLFKKLNNKWKVVFLQESAQENVPLDLNNN